MIIPPIRKHDAWGSGEYHASRGDRLHNGIDYACYPESVVCSDVRGVVKRIGYPYSQSSEKAEYRLIELEVDEQTLVRYFYVYPSVIPGEHIKRGAVLGIVQDITKHFTGMTPHYHFEVLIEGQHVNPNLWLTNYARYPAINSSDRRD